MSSVLSTTTVPSPDSTARATSSSSLALPWSTSEGRIRAGSQGRHDLAAPGHVEPEALLDHDALDRRARERLRREHDARPRPSRGEALAVGAGPRPESGLVHHQCGRPVRRRHLVEAHAAHGERPVGVERRGRREEAEQLVRHAVRMSVRDRG